MDQLLTHHTKAIKIYKHIKHLQKEAIFNMEKNINKFLEKEKIDYKTSKILKLLFKESPLSEQDKIELMTIKIADRLSESNYQSNQNQILLILEQNGNLYEKEDPKKCYALEEDSLRLNILRSLLGADTYVNTKKLQVKFNCSNKALGDAVRAINSKAQKFLNLPKGKKNQLTISKRGSGYMINPLYVIREKQ